MCLIDETFKKPLSHTYTPTKTYLFINHHLYIQIISSHKCLQEMGNCVFKSFEEEMIKVVTPNGGIMEFYTPITAENITNEFPGHAIYKSSEDHHQHQIISDPLLHNQHLLSGQLYYLLPINTTTSTSSVVTAYRMSLDNEKVLKRTVKAEVLPRYNDCGVWKVKLVISPEQLAEILAQETRTEALIESVRTVAKCGHGNGVSSGSDQ